VKACALALGRYPRINASFEDGGIIIHPNINIGVAVAVEDGLLLPVIGECKRLSLLEIAHTAHRLVAKADRGGFTSVELSGATFSISNMGMLGIEHFSAVIVPPQAAILAVSAIKERPVVRKGQVAAVAIFPSDHYVDDEAQFMHHVDLALEAVIKRSDRVVLLGVAPDAAEVDYGWVQVGPAISEDPLLFSITRFWEKPPRDLALRLREEGSFWNTFVLVARIRELLVLIMRALPNLCAAFVPLGATPGTWVEKTVVDTIYAQIPSVNFSEEVLQKHSQHLALCPVRNVKWSDLGDPGRVLAVLEWVGIRPQWSA
jgi:2-oxoacid dehydrogenases acyltransferase (catalytic domain)/Nucleotidyl transferase